MSKAKKTILGIITVAGTWSAGAHAQSSMVLYGVVDGGLLYKTNANAAGNHALSFGAGIENANRFGFRGVEDLGGGLAATVNLEGGFFLSNGQSIKNGVLFDRGATVGLRDKRLGWIQLGRNWIPFHDSLSELDATHFTNFGSLSNLSYQNLAAVHSGLTGAGFYWANNSIKYTSPKLDGFSASGLYSFGGKAGDFQNQSLFSFESRYDAGPLLLSAGYFSAKDPSGLTDKTVARAYDIGVRYKITQALDASIAMANYRDPATGDNQMYYTVTGSYRLAAQLFLLGDYFHLQNRVTSNGNGDLYKLALNYDLSKSTALYVDVGYTHNGPTGTLGLQNTIAAARPGDSQMGVGIGLRTAF